MSIGCEIVQEVDESLGKSPSEEDLSCVLKQLSTKPKGVRDWLQSLRSQDEAFQRVARQSYWHCNGFARIVLFATSRFAVRLHIWPAIANRRVVANPHGHRWEFSSWVAAGSGMTESYFREADRNEPAASPYLPHDYGGPGPLHRHDKPAWLREHVRFTHAPGTIHTCGRDIVHTVAPIDDELVVTVVLQGPAVAASTRVYVRPGNPPHGAERPMSAAELHTLLLRAERAIGSPV